MQLLSLDFETYYDPKDYTLRKMTTENYIRDTRFEALLVGIYSADGESVYVPKPKLREFFAEIDWANTAVIHHHAQFDAFILYHHFGVVPAFIFDTISMARIAYGPLQKVSLAALAEMHGMAPKTVPYDLFAGKRFHELDSHTKTLLGNGAVHDCRLTYDLFKLMLPFVPEIELTIIDRAMRMFSQPQMEGDLDMLHAICQQEVDKKAEIMAELGVNKKLLNSNEHFARLLENEGVEIEYKAGKPSTKTGVIKQIPAFAKTDQFMQDLLEHDNVRVATLAEARLGAKSTIQESRSGRLLTMAERGPICNYAYHAGAHTLRGSGGDKVNLRNLPRGSSLRKALRAPKGRKLSIKDFKQIELRTLLRFAGDEEKLKGLEEGRNLYEQMATKIFGVPISKKNPDQEEQYTLGKQVVLGCGYGMAETKFYHTCRGSGLNVSPELALTSVHAYRDEFFLVKRLWGEAKKMLPRIASGETFDWRGFHFEDKKCYAPNGSYMFFDTLQFGYMFDEDEANGIAPTWWMYTKANKKGRMYGAKLVENLTQFLARCVAMEALVRCPPQYQLVMESYDELVHVVDSKEEHDMLVELCSIRPDWAQDLPLEIDGGCYDRYEK